ncbi:hypothetical protein OS493_029474 [Desmophyllum pertusum]|uniref:START domain-containing protein n=1 Tax=Desmophyllum pertusum TaxID=174260 RepID=A0A9X0CDA9_9CNID|nr:hypothetical protein OS493_029474 [Desmophyllum pertusum]
MQSSKDDFLTSFSYDKEIERAKWFTEDLDKGGWKEIHKSPGNVYWLKTFPDEQVPIKVLSRVDLAMSAEMYMEMQHPRNEDKRGKWDRVFVDHEILETYPDDQGVVNFSRLTMFISALGSFVHNVLSISKRNRLVRHSERLFRFKRTPGTRRKPRELMVLSERQTEGIFS